MNNNHGGILKRKSVLIIFLCIHYVVGAQKKSDFFIAEDPKSLTILNNYEQIVSPAEKQRFHAYAPLQVIEVNHLLSDQLSKGMQFKFGNARYYLLKDERGNFVADTKKQYFRLFKNCTVVNDTVQIVKNETVLLYERYPAEGKRVYLQRGENIIRIFQFNQRYCVFVPGRENRYGWIMVNLPAAWRPIEKISFEKQSGNITEVIRIVDSKIRDINKHYRNYFQYFNTQSSKQLSIPYWNTEVKGQTIFLTLNNVSDTQALEESTHYLVRDLQQLLSAKSYTVTTQHDVIQITPLF